MEPHIYIYIHTYFFSHIFPWHLCCEIRIRIRRQWRTAMAMSQGPRRRAHCWDPRYWTKRGSSREIWLFSLDQSTEWYGMIFCMIWIAFLDDMQVSIDGGSPHPLMAFPWNTPSCSWCTPMTMESFISQSDDLPGTMIFHWICLRLSRDNHENHWHLMQLVIVPVFFNARVDASPWWIGWKKLESMTWWTAGLIRG